MTKDQKTAKDQEHSSWEIDKGCQANHAYAQHADDGEAIDPEMHVELPGKSDNGKFHYY